MKKIAFVCDWGESSADLLIRYSRQTPAQSGIWKGLEGINNLDLADIVVVLGGAKVPIDKSNSLLVVREPDFFRTPNVDGYDHVIRWQDAYCGVTWWLSKTYDELMAMEPPEKTRKVSCIASNRHPHRNEMIERLVIKKNWQIWRKSGLVDLFGRGHDPQIYGEVYKGPIESNGNCKLDGLQTYEYSIALENSQQHNYWTEKLADVILAWCFPIYWGCPNYLDYFDKDSVFLIDSNASYIDIVNHVKQPITEKMMQSLSEARMKVLNEYNIWEVIYKKIENDF